MPSPFLLCSYFVSFFFGHSLLYRHILFLLSRDVFLTLRARLRSMFLSLVANNTTRRYSDVRSSTIRDPLFKHNRIYRSDPVVGTTESLGLC